MEVGAVTERIEERGGEPMAAEKQYIAIDLKSFYASVECAERGMDPLDANLVVADESRTDKTICLAVSPALKAYGIPGRPRLFEVRRAVREINRQRLAQAPGHRFTGSSVFASELAADPSLELSPVIAQPRMAYYMDYSKSIVEIYMRYVSPEDILIYSIDEVFIDATPYLTRWKMTAHDFAMMLIRQVLGETRITATAGIGTNLYLAKIAMDIVAKKMPPDADGVRIAALNEKSYREKLWTHRPLTDFWRVGRGTANRLESHGLYTMGDVARCSAGKPGQLYSEDLLYKLFGVNAELLIDHAWGWEPVAIADCRSYVPETRSLSRGQVLPEPYEAEKGRIVVCEMADLLSEDLVRKGLVTDQVVLHVGYDVENLKVGHGAYEGAVKSDFYGRQVPKSARGSANFGEYTASTGAMIRTVGELYDRIVDKKLTVRRFSVSVEHLLTEQEALAQETPMEQLDLFDDGEEARREKEEKKAARDREMRMQKALISIRDRFGKNAVVKGLNLQEGATAIERNSQIGGHKA